MVPHRSGSLSKPDHKPTPIKCGTVTIVTDSIVYTSLLYTEPVQIQHLQSSGADPPRRYNSYDNILPGDCSRVSQFDSGKHSLTSSDNFSTSSNEVVHDLIDFDHVMTTPSAMAELDPLRYPVMPITATPTGTGFVPTSHDSLFSDTNSPISVGGVRGFTPPLRSNVSPRSSMTDFSPTGGSIARPRPRPSSTQDINSAPTSRPNTPKLNISPSGSVHSLPQYPTTTSCNDVSYFTSGSSTSIDFDDTLFDHDTMMTALHTTLNM